MSRNRHTRPWAASASAVSWRVCLAFVLALTFLPFVFMLMTSLKDTHQFYHSFWLPKLPLQWGNYAYAFREMKMYILNSLFITAVSVTGITVLSCLAGFVFARYEFPGRETLYYGIIVLMMIPGVLMLVPAFVWAREIDMALKGLDGWLTRVFQLKEQLGLKFIDSHWVMIMPYMAGGQVLGIYLLRGFFSQIDKDLFEAAEVDGAGPMRQLWHVAIPLARPVIGVVVIVSALAVWNNFLWPLVTTSSEDVMVITVGMLRYTTRAGARYGEMFAGYTVSAIPLAILFALCTRMFMKGITSGALKA